MPALVVVAAGQQLRLDQFDEGTRLRRQELALAHHDAVAARREPTRDVALALPPEGKRKLVERWKPGFWHIAGNAGVPGQFVELPVPAYSGVPPSFQVSCR